MPDLREIPDCPRKTVDERTMVEHRNCFKAAEDRIRVGLRHGKLVRTNFLSTMSIPLQDAEWRITT